MPRFLAAAVALAATSAAAQTVECPEGLVRTDSGCRTHFGPDTPPPAIGPASTYTGPMPSIRSNAIWNSLSLGGRMLSPSSGEAEYGGALGYDVFTVPEQQGELDLTARLGAAGGYSQKGSFLFDATLGLGAGYTMGDFTVMALCWIVWDGVSGADAPALQVPSGLAAGPELHAQLWLARSLSLDLSAARVFRVIGDEALDGETRLSAALGLGSVSLGAAYIDYGIGHALAGTLAVRWGAR